MEESVIQFIRSLLTSSPVAVRMFELDRDYRNTIGEPIPYHKLGYNSLEHFLRSIPETVCVRGIGREAEIIPVITEKSAHVNALVARQKVNTKSKRGYTSARKNFIATPIVRSKKIHYPQQWPEASTSKVEGPGKEPPIMNKPVIKNVPSNNSTPVNTTKPIEPIKVSNIDKEVIEATKTAHEKSNESSRTKIVDEKVCSQTKHKNSSSSPKIEQNGATFEKKAVPLKAQNFTFKFGFTKKGIAENPEERFDDDSPTNSTVPPYIQKNLKHLIEVHPEGVWCAQLPSIYRRMFGKQLHYEEFGFRSLIELCTSLTSVFHYVRPSTGDFRLYDRSKPLPENAEKKFTLASYSPDDDADNNNALPTIDWEDVMTFLPKNIVQPGTDIPRDFVPESTKEYDTFEIVPGEIYDLSKFWVYLDNGVLDQLMDDLQEFYKSFHNDYIMPEHLVREGLYCVHVIFGEYHRALVVDILPEVPDMIRLLYIDYGTVAKAPLKGLCFMHEKFAQVPAQAIRCRLANVVPPLEGAPWSKEACKCFRELVTERTLVANIIKVNWQDQYLDIFMVDMTDPNDKFYINDKLVLEGHAQFPDKERKKYKIDAIHKCKVKQIHLFPTFMELEHGLAPSTVEMGVYDECSIPLHFAFPQYFETDTSANIERIRTTELCVKQKLKQKREIHHYDVSKLKRQPLDLSIFGDLAEDLMDMVKTENLYDEFLFDSEHKVWQENGAVEEKNEDESTQLEIKEFAQKLKKDCLLAQDIMKDLGIANDDASKTLNENLNFMSSEGFWALNDNFVIMEDSTNISKDSSTSIPEQTLSNSEYLPAVTSSSDISLVEDDYLGFPANTPSYNEDSNMYIEAKETESSSNFSIKSTNPFLENLDDHPDDIEASMKGLVLNSNNPFLRKFDKEIEESSSSTVYETAIEKLKMTPWSTDGSSRSDNLSDYDSVASNRSSASSVIVENKVMNSCAMATVIQDVKVNNVSDTSQKFMSHLPQPSMVHHPPVMPPEQPCMVQQQSFSNFNYPQSWSPGYNNFGYGGYPQQPFTYNYNAYRPPMYPQDTGYPYRMPYQQHSYIPQVYPYTSGYHARFPQPSAPSVRPPPGFHPNANVFQFSRISQTTVRSNVVTDSDSPDFYELYNAKLKLALSSSNSDRS